MGVLKVSPPSFTMLSVGTRIKKEEEDNSFEFERTVFYPEQEGCHDIPEAIHYNININVLPRNSEKREKSMLFGVGVYLSPLPGVSMMYGDGLLLCKVLLGKYEEYHP